MPTMGRAAICLATAVLLSLPSAGNPAQSDDEVKLEIVKAKDFAKRLEAFRGKVVVLDVWAEFCLPCKKEFPHLVELHEKYAKKGVACISVSVDFLEDQDKTLAFLKKHKATFTNYLFDEKQKVWQQHFNITGPPAVFVYDRDGKLAKHFDPDEGDGYTYADVEKLVQKLLAK
jgi:thiol-disulfide isomerase/thioredoxin